MSRGLELQSVHPDYTRAANGFIAGRNHPDDVPGLVRLFRLFRHSALLARPISAWTRADEFIVQLDDIGLQMQAAVADGSGGRERAGQLLAAAELIHRGVAPLEDEFSTSLGSTSRLVLRLLSAFLALCSVVLVSIGAAISRNMIRRSERIALALREAEEQAFVAQARSHVTLQSIADAVLCTNRSCEVTYMNAAAEQLLGWPAADAVGQPLAAVLRMAAEPNCVSVTSAIDEILAGAQRTGPTTGSMLQKRDGFLDDSRARARRPHPRLPRRGDRHCLRDARHHAGTGTFRAAAAPGRRMTCLGPGFANRREFEQQVGWAIADQKRSGSAYALLYVDLDQFKVVNDTCGHAAGDELDLPGVLGSQAGPAQRRCIGASRRRRVRRAARELPAARGAAGCRVHPPPYLGAAIHLGGQGVLHQRQHRGAVADGQPCDGR